MARWRYIAGGLIAIGVISLALWWPGKSPQVATKSGGHIRMDRTEIDLGRVAPGHEKEMTFVVENIGSQPVRVLDVRQSCGCSPATIRSPVIAPGGSEPVVVKYRVPLMAGVVSHAVWLTTDAENTREVQLRFRAVVRWPLEVTPDELDLGQLTAAGTNQRQIKLLADDGQRFRVTGIAAPSGVRVVKVSGEDEDVCHRYDVITTTTDNTGDLSAVIQLTTTHPERPTINIPLRATISREPRYTPSKLAISGKRGEELKAIVQFSGEAAAVRGVKIADTAWRIVTHKAERVAGRTLLSITFLPIDRAGYHRTSLQVDFDGDVSPIQIPLNCYLAE